ncbi:MAG: hypothetical protein OSB62_03490 [Alphaproteobacteria bacterium]|nr:hypothetical protein [Alphaproteobacteria bacterium]
MSKIQILNKKTPKPSAENLTDIVKEAEKNAEFSKGVWPGPEKATGAQSFMMFDPNKRMVHVVWDTQRVIKH